MGRKGPANWSRKSKTTLILLADFLILPVALWCALCLRYESLHPPMPENSWWLFLFLPAISIPIFYQLGLYRTVIRYMSERVVYSVVGGVTLSTLGLMMAVYMGQLIPFPRTSIVLYWIISIIYLLLSRYLARNFLRRLEKGKRRRERVAIYGAGNAGRQTAVALLASPEFIPVAFFDDDKSLHGTSVMGIRVYNPEVALEIMSKKNCSQLLLAIPSASRSRRKQIIQEFEGAGIELKTLPGLEGLVHGTVNIEDVRPVGVEDLLGRDPVAPLDELLAKTLRGHGVMVTGAGGSIGSELCRQIIRSSPRILVLFEVSEYNLYQIEKELLRYNHSAPIISVLGDVKNKDHILKTLRSHEIQTVFHAAAYKHVPLVENNICEGINNNVFGTLSVAQAANEAGVENFILVSTDKAVRPTNVMGASKRMCELIIQGLASMSGQNRTTYTIVRFGNVLDSSGSVIPLFKEQIQRGGPVTVTHPEVTRYFMTIPEAAQLVIQAGAMSSGGDVFVLDMGEPVKIVDLAKRLVTLSGLTVKNVDNPDGDIELQFIGLRPGEKLYEELLIGENVVNTAHPRIMRAEERYLPWSELETILKDLKHLCDLQISISAKKLLNQAISL